MENFHEMLLKRHSIRRYTDTPIDGEHVRAILEAGLLAPSSKSKRPWQFVVVEDRDMLVRLAEMKTAGNVSLKNTGLAIVVTVSPETSDMFIEDASVAAIMMQLQAEALGIGSCWVQVRNRFTADGESSETYVQELLGIPADQTVECIVTFGYSAENRKPVDPDKLLWEKVHLGEWRHEQTEF
ncbi:MAG: nitroreductase family protein [Muribaculaceae bacterium]|nr:nitroreductase family protein [Muribaculaceae bacterium]MDE6134133.1 nitroreductase family protein [Muribaculaceae bacterium]